MADIKLPPSSVAAFTEALHGDRGSLDAWLEVHDEREVRAHVEAYARANVLHHTAALQAEIEGLREQLRLSTVDQVNAEAEANDARAEIEALRAEVEAWRELSDHVRVWACAAIWPDRYTDARTRDVAAALKRAERLAEALRKLEGREQSESFLEANDE